MGIRKQYIKALDETLRRFDKSSELEDYNRFLAQLFSGIAKNELFPTRFRVDIENRDGAPVFIASGDWSESLVLLTDQYEDESKGFIMPLRIRSLLKDMEKKGNCDGIIFNPYEDYELFVPVELINSAIKAGAQIIQDELEKQGDAESEEDNNTLVLQRLVEESDYSIVEKRIRELESNDGCTLKIIFVKEDENLLFAQIMKCVEEDMVQLSFGLDMEQYGWSEPLVLGKEMAMDEAISMLRRVCVDGEEPNNMEEVEHFRKVN